ncbi:MAG: galactokinase family protein [Clostridia bacterium]|nr:galactokinase family protein [Clostridia bacterium]
MRCEEVFESIYRNQPQSVAFCPYRICPIGAHSDHQYGKITGFAIDKGVHMAYRPKHNGVVELSSLNFEKRAQFHISQVPPRQSDWADYLRGATVMLANCFPLHNGISGVIEGTIPIGGLSSSAAVILAFLSAMCDVNDIRLSNRELIETALKAETDYVGVSVGKLDQSCEVLSRKDHLLYLDTRDDSYELIPSSPDMKPYEVAIFFSGVERSLASSKFNMRVDELKSAAYALKGYAVDGGFENALEVPYGRFVDARLRDVPRDVFERYKDRLPSMWLKRATHFYTEFERVEKGAEAWRNGDMQTYGKLVFESGESSIYNYETGSEELIALYEIMRETAGVYGGRFSGAGFKGCCMALTDPAYRDKIISGVTERYLRRFPHMEGRFSVHICRSADGVGNALRV